MWNTLNKSKIAELLSQLGKLHVLLLELQIRQQLARAHYQGMAIKIQTEKQKEREQDNVK